MGIFDQERRLLLERSIGARGCGRPQVGCLKMRCRGTVVSSSSRSFSWDGKGVLVLPSCCVECIP